LTNESAPEWGASRETYQPSETVLPMMKEFASETCVAGTRRVNP